MERARQLNELEQERAETARLRVQIDAHKENDPEILRELGLTGAFEAFKSCDFLKFPCQLRRIQVEATERRGGSMDRQYLELKGMAHS